MLTVRSAIAAEVAAGLMLQFRRYPIEERNERLTQLLAAKKRGDSKFECLVAIERNEIVGAQLLVQQRDGTLYVWPVELEKSFGRSAQAKTARTRLYALADQHFLTSDVWIAQTLLELDRHNQSAEMTQHGFPYLTDLLFLGRSFIEADPIPEPTLTLPSISFDEPLNGERFARVLESTYEGTLDCPELNAGERTGRNALEGHKLAGQFDARGWRLFQQDGDDIGIVLLTQHFPDPIWEVVYIGVVPSARGRGLGRVLLIDTLRYAFAQGAWQVVLGVDSRNQPAIAMYEALGFTQIERRMVHARLK